VDTVAQNIVHLFNTSLIVIFSKVLCTKLA